MLITALYNNEILVIINSTKKEKAKTTGHDQLETFEQTNEYNLLYKFKSFHTISLY